MRLSENFEANKASKQPQRSDLTSDLKCVAQMLHDTTFVLPVWASDRSLRRRLRTSKRQRPNPFVSFLRKSLHSFLRLRTASNVFSGSTRPVGFAAGKNVAQNYSISYFW